MNIKRAGVDIAISAFHIHGVDRHDRVQRQTALTRGQWLEALCKRFEPGAAVAREACASPHYWARELSYKARVLPSICRL